MKQKIANDPPITKSILQAELKVLKSEFKKEFSNHPTNAKVEMMFEQSERRTDEKARQYRDEVLTRMDQIVGELAQAREDKLFERHEKRELQEQIGDHEKRIKKLENHKN
jgi:hypothetical protein